jgi:hypothetical protein
MQDDYFKENISEKEKERGIKNDKEEDCQLTRETFYKILKNVCETDNDLDDEK